MHSPEQTRRPQKPRPELSLNTSSAVSRSRDVAPEAAQTRKPPFPIKGKPPVSSRGLRLPTSGSAANSKRNSDESFLDNDSPVDAEKIEFDYRHVRPPRDSHDLSLPAQKFTRDSLLGNMLNSLDQFSLFQINTPTATAFDDDGDPYGVPRGDAFARTVTSVSRPPASMSASGITHGHGYSYSSEFEGFDDSESKISSQVSRGRRSDSSSGFQSGLPRINSMREQSHPGTPAKRALHSRGGKSSSTNSFDIGGGGYAQVLPTQRWGHAVRGRSSSFDSGQRPSLSSSGAWKTEFSNTFLVDDYEAAPTPTVPGGPRRPLVPSSSAVNPPMPLSEHEPKTPDRKRDTRSRSGTNKTAQSKYSTTREVAPPLPSLNVDSAPAPHVGYGKSKEVQAAGPVPAPPAKEKQGFFSRLFGSSRLNASSAVEPFPAPAPAPAPPVPVESFQGGIIKTNHIASQMKPQSTPPTRDSELPRQMPHVIQKKSSFFRRRKKSIAEPPVPPLPSADVSKTTDSSIPMREPSPVSSLRQVMNPYLKSSNPAVPQDTSTSQRDSTLFTIEPKNRDENNRRTRGFSPEYEPSPNATIRTVKSTSALKSHESRWRGHMESPLRSPPDVPAKSTNTPDSTTFFHDSSDEGEKGPASRRKQRPRAQTGKPVSSGTTLKSKLTPVPLGHQGTGDLGASKPEPSPNLLLQNNTNEEDQTLASLDVPTGSRKNSASRPTLSRAGSSVPSVTIDSSQASPLVPTGPLDEPEVSIGDPTEDDRQKAQGIFDGDEDFIQKEKAAAWMGEEGPVRQRTLRAYMDLYDFENQSVLTALRQVCTRLVFRAETQQVDRILVAFSSRWCDCNPNHGFKTTDVIHTMCYSIMLLNTDLHLADIDQKMTRSQFVKNTMSTITQALVDSDPRALNRSSILPSKNSLLSPTGSEATSTLVDGEQDKPSWRASFKPPPRSESALGFHADSGTPVDTCGPLVKAPFDGPIRAWEGQVEIVLKDIYMSIRDEKLPVFGADPNYQQAAPQSSLSVIGMLKRSPSVLSKAPSEGQASLRGRINEASRTQGSRWSSKSRSRPRIGNGFSSSRTSFDDGNSIWSPAASSATWSKHSLGRTQASMSIDSFGSGYPNGDYQQSIGFANALSQAIIREDYPVGNSAQSVMSEDFPGAQLLEDESLELNGPPWVKEGIVIHKHHLDGVDKKAKDRNWNEVFAVVQKGTMSLFSFSTKSMRQKARTGRKHAAGAVVGGGNWQENATSVGSFSLRQTLASALPPPGYSRTRPHVWALSLPSGAVHLFQVGTPEISKEFVLTVNYWSARLSTHPLVGGISNIEYGWSDAVINNALIGAMEEPAMPQRPGSAAAGRTSTHSRQGSRQSSLRSSFDVGGSARTKLPGDRIHIAEWSPPSQSLRPSQCSESEQLETLLAYVKSVESELQQHNQLRSPMLLAFTPRGHNAGKAMANWERKSSYLLREIVKFRTYVDCLQHASERRHEIYTERENARRAARGEELSDSASSHSDEADITLKVE